MSDQQLFDGLEKAFWSGFDSARGLAPDQFVPDSGAAEWMEIGFEPLQTEAGGLANNVFAESMGGKVCVGPEAGPREPDAVRRHPLVEGSVTVEMRGGKFVARARYDRSRACKYQRPELCPLGA